MASSAELIAPARPSFVIFAHGFWGSMDDLPSRDPAWLRSSPYPHYRKHQEAAFLGGSGYRPIPQAYLRFLEGPSLSRLAIAPYALMQREFDFWARRRNQGQVRARVSIIDNWERLRTGAEDPVAGAVNLIYLKYDWRLGLPQADKHYAAPLLSFLRRRWPGAEIHWVGHSQGGLFGRYVAARHPGALSSLVTIGAPHYGIHEIAMQLRGEYGDFGGQTAKEKWQEYSLCLLEQLIFGTGIVRTGPEFTKTAAIFAERYVPFFRWLDPQAGLLQDGFGTLTKLEEAVPKAVALYGLGYGAYDMDGRYHYEVTAPEKSGVGPGLGPAGPPGYAESGDGRVDPVSARGPFRVTLCLGKDMVHSDMMWSPLVLTFLVDRFFFNGGMARKDMELALLRLDVAPAHWQKRLAWLLQARRAWDAR